MIRPRRTAGLRLLLGVGVVISVLAGLLLALPILAGRDGPRPIMLFVAAGQRAAIEPAVRDFQTMSGRHVDVVWGGTGTLYGQTVAGAPCDVFVSADAATVERGVRDGRLADPHVLAMQRAVISVAAGNPKQIWSLADLQRRDVRFALADPDQAAVGRVARRALLDAGVWPALRERIVVSKPTVTDAAADLRLGAVDVTVLWAHLIPTLAGVEALELVGLSLGEEPVVAARVVGGDGDALLTFLASPAAATHIAATGMRRP